MVRGLDGIYTKQKPSKVNQVSKPPIDPDRRRQLQGYSLGTEFAFSIIGAAAFGALLDWWLKSSPVVLLIMLGAGFIGGGYNFLRRAVALNREGVAAFRAAHPHGVKKSAGGGAIKAHEGPMPSLPTPKRAPDMFGRQSVDIEETDDASSGTPLQDREEQS